MTCRQALFALLLLSCFTLCGVAQESSGQNTPSTITGTGKKNFVPVWLAPSQLGNSNIYDSGGRIGIGTTNPSSTLSVNGTATATEFSGSGSGLTGVNASELGGLESSAFAQLGGLVNQFTGTNETNFDTIVDYTNSNSGQYTPGFRFGGTISGESIASARVMNSPNQYGIDFWTAFANRMSITNAGLVGIGTTSPAYQLDVNNGDAVVRGSHNFTNSGDVANLYVGDQYHVIRATNALGLGLGAFGQFPGVYIQDTTGWVGIHTTQPQAVFAVAQGQGYAVADGWTTYSSRRWKTNIHTLHGALDTVERLRGVSYDTKDTGKHQIGVIAEEVGAVVPEVVSWEKNGKDAKGVDYGRLTALLIEATKEQQKLIQQQQRQIKAQQAALSVQGAKLTALASQMRTVQTALKASGRSDPLLLAASTQLATINH